MLNDNDILAARGPRNIVDPSHAYHALVEQEYSADGAVEDVATIFLTNRECAFRCLMCDLWKNTTTQRVSVGAIPQQIQQALDKLPPAQHIKLYNSGNFFDAQAIPPEDHSDIAQLGRGFRTVIVENHPRLCDERCARFQDLCETQLEVALGLETSYEPTLRQLNKRMTTDDFRSACQRLHGYGIRLRTFILLRPPDTSEEEGIERAVNSVKFAFDCGVNCCAVIPTRAGNGIMEQLQQQGRFHRPQLRSLETVLEECLSWKRGRVFADLWDAQIFGNCPACTSLRIQRLQTMNLTQKWADPVKCSVCG